MVRLINENKNLDEQPSIEKFKSIRDNINRIVMMNRKGFIDLGDKDYSDILEKLDSLNKYLIGLTDKYRYRKTRANTLDIGDKFIDEFNQYSEVYTVTYIDDELVHTIDSNGKESGIILTEPCEVWVINQ